MDISKFMGVMKRPFHPNELFRTTDGAWFDSSDMSTMFQDAAGTTPVTALEQPVGLWLDKSQGLELGPELVTNGDFSNGTTGWYSEAGTILNVSNGAITVASDIGGFDAAAQIINTTANTYYEVICAKLEGGATNGKLRIYSSSSGKELARVSYTSSVAQKLRLVFMADTTSVIVQLFVDSASSYASFDNISVREIKGNHATQSITASRPTLSARYNLLTKTEDFANAAWSKTAGGVGSIPLVTPNFGVAPDGTYTACRVQLALNGGTTTSDLSNFYQIIPTVAGSPVAHGVWTRTTDGSTKTIRIDFSSVLPTSGSANITVDGTWRYTERFLASAADTNRFPIIRLRGMQGTSDSADILIWHPNIALQTSLPLYQRVNTATDYDTDPTKFPKYLNFDGIDDYLNLPYLGLYANGSTSIIAALDSRTQATNAALVSERNSTVATQQYIPSRRVTNDGIDAYVVNDAGSVVKDTNGTTASLRTKTVRSIVDNGQNINIFKDGILSGYDEYTRAGSLSLDNTTIGASISSTNSMFMCMNLYGLIITKSAIPDTYRRLAENMLARKIGMQVYNPITAIDSIGVPGEAFFGVGRVSRAPTGYTELTGDDNYGNYQYSDGSVQVCVPQFWERYGHVDNPTYAAYGVNSVDIKPKDYFASEAVANSAGYSLNRAFIDGNQHKLVVFVDKYICSNNGGIASSLKNGNPLSTTADHNPISGLTGAPSNSYGGAWEAAKTRGSNFFVASRFIYAALALLSLAHGQAATSATNCAWYDAAGVTNFPKGCNNNALRDNNDTSVLYTSDGYSNCGKTGSGVPFAKTTHNGQACGIADLNGLMWEISQGVTCIATTKTITGATQTNPVNLTIVGHGMTTGKALQVSGVVGMTQLNDKIYTVAVVDADHVTLNGTNGAAFTPYTSGGSATYGTFYVAKESAVMANFTGGNTLATDHFGVVGVTANMNEFTPAFATNYSSNGFAQRIGNGVNQVLSPGLTGNNAVLRSLGVPMAARMSISGSNLFGQDYFYQYIRNELCLPSGANWYGGSGAGVWASTWDRARTDSSYLVGFRSASYPVSEWGSDDA